MPCSVLPSNAPGYIQTPGRSVNPRGVWSPRFFGTRLCSTLPMMGKIEDQNWSTVEHNIIVGVGAVQNAWPPFAQQPYTGPPPVPPGGAGPSLQVVPVNQPNTWSVNTAIPDAGLQMNLFVDECVLQTAYGPNNPWSVGGPFPPGNDGCSYAYVTIAPMGTGTVTGRGGAQVLNACPMVVAEVSGVASTPPFFQPGWRACTYNLAQGAGPPVTYNLCPPSNPGAGYVTCAGTPPATIGNTRMIQAIDLNANSMTWMRGQQFLTQVHYLIPNVNNPIQHLYVASQIQTKQVM